MTTDHSTALTSLAGQKVVSRLGFEPARGGPPSPTVLRALPTCSPLAQPQTSADPHPGGLIPVLSHGGSPYRRAG